MFLFQATMFFSLDSVTGAPTWADEQERRSKAAGEQRRREKEPKVKQNDYTTRTDSNGRLVIYDYEKNVHTNAWLYGRYNNKNKTIQIL